MTILYISIYVLGFLVTAYINGPKNAHGEEDAAGQTGVALMWPLIAVFLIMVSPIFIVQQLNKFRK
jgi:hypothetical protein